MQYLRAVNARARLARESRENAQRAFHGRLAEERNGLSLGWRRRGPGSPAAQNLDAGQQRGRADLIAEALLDLTENPEKRAAQAEAMSLTMKRLGEGGAPPGLLVAKSVLDFLSRRDQRRA